MSAEQQPDSMPDGNASPAQTLITLLLIIHLFFVIVATCSRYAPSQFQTRLLDRFAIYTRSLHLDPSFTNRASNVGPFQFSAEPMYLTHAAEEDVDHRIELLPEGRDGADDSNWIVLPSSGFRGGERYRRYQRLAKFMVWVSPEDADVGRLAQSIGANERFQKNRAPQQVRCRRHMLRSMDAVAAGISSGEDANSANYFQTPYTAKLLFLENDVQVVKSDAASQVAQPSSSDGPVSGNRE